MARLALLATLSWCALIGCARSVAQQPAIAPGIHAQAVQIAGLDRTFDLYVPKSYDAAKPTPLVLLFHGWGGNAKGIAQGTGFAAKAEKEGFLLAVPQGLGQQPGWNAEFIDLSGRRQDEAAFASLVLDRVESLANVDKQRVFVAGHSNGAMLAHHLGSKLSKRVAGIAAVAGVSGVPSADGKTMMRVAAPAEPLSVLLVHGKQDPLVAYGPEAAGFLKGVGVQESARWWAKQIGASEIPKAVPGEDPKIVVEVFEGGAKGAKVMTVSLADAGHEWPTLNGRGAQKVSATDIIWDFFKSIPPRNSP